MAQIQAPFTPDQVDSLNVYQNAGLMHPFTCGNNSDHLLVAREDGWFCPECDYRQYWAHDWMTNWKWSGMVRQMVKDGTLNDDV